MNKITNKELTNKSTNNDTSRSQNDTIITRQVLGRPVCDRGTIPRR